MKFLLTITTDNAAFHGEDCEGDNNLPPNTLCDCWELRDAIAAILKDVAGKVQGGDLDGLYHTIFDANGNNVGAWAGKPESSH